MVIAHMCHRIPIGIVETKKGLEGKKIRHIYYQLRNRITKDFGEKGYTAEISFAFFVLCGLPIRKQDLSKCKTWDDIPKGKRQEIIPSFIAYYTDKEDITFPDELS